MSPFVESWLCLIENVLATTRALSATKIVKFINWLCEFQYAAKVCVFLYQIGNWFNSTIHAKLVWDEDSYISGVIYISLFFGQMLLFFFSWGGEYFWLHPGTNFSFRINLLWDNVKKFSKRSGRPTTEFKTTLFCHGISRTIIINKFCQHHHIWFKVYFLCMYGLDGFL